ncbi:MAG: hypothetical protein WD295_03090 [Bacteroidota bacterium]
MENPSRENPTKERFEGVARQARSAAFLAILLLLLILVIEPPVTIVAWLLYGCACMLLAVLGISAHNSLKT